MDKVLIAYGTKEGQTRKIAAFIGSTDTNKNTEYTDWSEVRKFTQNFAKHLPHFQQRVVGAASL